jgi:hypothetical protein
MVLDLRSLLGSKQSSSDDADDCPECRHDQSGYPRPRWWIKRHEARGESVAHAYCGTVIHDYGAGDAERCACANAVHVEWVTARRS